MVTQIKFLNSNPVQECREFCCDSTGLRGTKRSYEASTGLKGGSHTGDVKESHYRVHAGDYGELSFFKNIHEICQKAPYKLNIIP